MRAIQIYTANLQSHLAFPSRPPEYQQRARNKEEAAMVGVDVSCCGATGTEVFFNETDEDDYDYDEDYDHDDDEESGVLTANRKFVRGRAARTGDDTSDADGVAAGMVSSSSDSTSSSEDGGKNDKNAVARGRRRTTKAGTTTVTDRVKDDRHGLTNHPDILQTTYSRRTQLFRAIEDQQWESILIFLKTGKWSGGQLGFNFLQNRFSFGGGGCGTDIEMINHGAMDAVTSQCKTWVIRNDALALNELPLHRAIAKGAPAIVLEHLVERYPDAVQCCDSQDRLPVHLAFMHGASDAVVLFLLRAWPQSFRTSPQPFECGAADSLRNEIIRIAVQETQAGVHRQHEEAWRNLVKASNGGGGVTDAVTNDAVTSPQQQKQLDTTDLPTVLAQLLADRKQLQEMKAGLCQQFPVVTPSTTFVPPPPPPRSMSSSSSLSPGALASTLTMPTSNKSRRRSSWGRRRGRRGSGGI
jgi:hypothetical protein